MTRKERISTKDWKQSNRPRPTKAAYPNETPFEYLMRCFSEGKFTYKDGNIYSHFDNRGKGNWRNKPVKIGSVGKRGYVRYNYRFNGNYYAQSIHRMVYAYFNGITEYEEGMEINHKDGNPSNNRIENLELVTSKENKQHALNTGLRKVENTNTTKLSWEKVREIREILKEGKLSTRELADIYCVDKSTINSIKLNKTWKEKRCDSDAS